jgi:glutathione S-transferase
MTILDALSEAEMAYHPVDRNASYSSQHLVADACVATFVVERLPVFLAVLEKGLAYYRRRDGAAEQALVQPLESNAESRQFFFGNAVTIVDIALFQFIRGFKTSQPAAFDANHTIPLIKQHFTTMSVEPKIAAFLASDRCTKLESPSASPLAEPPNIQTNSFM